MTYWATLLSCTVCLCHCHGPGPCLYLGRCLCYAESLYFCSVYLSRCICLSLDPFPRLHRFCLHDRCSVRLRHLSRGADLAFGRDNLGPWGNHDQMRCKGSWDGLNALSRGPKTESFQPNARSSSISRSSIPLSSIDFSSHLHLHLTE